MEMMVGMYNSVGSIRQHSAFHVYWYLQVETFIFLILMGLDWVLEGIKMSYTPKICSSSKQRRQFSSTVVISVIPPQGVVSFNNLWMLRSEPKKRLASCERPTTKCFQISMHHSKVVTAVP
jgi:hypothetical protein